MSYIDFSGFENALAERTLQDERAAQVRGTDLPHWLVDPDFDAIMAALPRSATAADAVLPGRTRLAIFVALTVAAWVPVVLVGAWLWS